MSSTSSSNPLWLTEVYNSRTAWLLDIADKRATDIWHCVALPLNDLAGSEGADHFVGSIPFIWCPPLLYISAESNLISNAISCKKMTPQTTTMTISGFAHTVQSIYMYFIIYDSRALAFILLR